MTRQQGAKDLHLVLTALGVQYVPRDGHMGRVKTVFEALQYQGATVDRVIDRGRRHIEKGQGNRHAYVSHAPSPWGEGWSEGPHALEKAPHPHPLPVGEGKESTSQNRHDNALAGAYRDEMWKDHIIAVGMPVPPVGELHGLGLTLVVGGL